MRNLIYGIVAALFVLASCEEVPVVITSGPGGGDTTATVQKKVLIEELTGVSCPNCPAGTAALEAILTVFEGRVVSNAIHGQFLAQPTSSSIYDFRYDDARDLENELAPFLGKPAAVVDRVHFEDEDFQTVDNIGRWQSLVSQRLEEKAMVDIRLNVSYNESTRQASVEAEVEAVEDIEGIMRLMVLINESYLIDAQSNQTEIIPDYEHNHVMKEMLSAVQGDILASEGMEAGEIISRSFSYTVPDEVNGEWIPENMEIISFVTASFFDGEVLQAESAYLKE